MYNIYIYCISCRAACLYAVYPARILCCVYFEIVDSKANMYTNAIPYDDCAKICIRTHIQIDIE